MNRFETFMSQLVPTNATLGYYCDFDKALRNVSKLRVKLSSLSALAQTDKFDEVLAILWEEYPQAFEVLPLLIAVRDAEKSHILDSAGHCRTMSSYLDSLEGIRCFMEETGLRQFFAEAKPQSLVDYVLGIEVGLDTNARKNRVGKLMERHVSTCFERASLDFAQEVYSSTYPEVAAALGVDTKRFDFVVRTRRKTYLIEVNFYSSAGSKLNEVARAYTELAPRVNSVEGFEFIWITDGIGWHGAKSKLQEAFSAIPRIYNLTTLPLLISELQAEG
ncbi:MAG: type II restriction endonuclease [Porphyromonas sp.]|nr:type II restriction endonuclease [Porphyromonas sp.]